MHNRSNVYFLFQVNDVLRFMRVGIRPLAEEYQSTSCHYDIVINSKSAVQKMIGYEMPEFKWTSDISEIGSIADHKFVNVKGCITNIEPAINQYDISGKAIKLTKFTLSDPSQNSVNEIIIYNSIYIIHPSKYMYF